MNYYKIIQRGSRYVNQAGCNWERRKSRLITACSKPGCMQKGRIHLLIDEIDLRLTELIRLIHIYQEKDRNNTYAMGQMMVNLYCPTCRLDPNALGIAIRYIDFLADNKEAMFVCNICGRDLEIEEQREIDIQLLKLGIR